MGNIWLLQVNLLTFLSNCILLNCQSGEDLAISLWDLGSGKRIQKMTGHSSSIYSLAFSNESSLLVSGGADWTVRCWDVKAADGFRSTRAQKDGAMSLNGSHSYGDDESPDTYVFEVEQLLIRLMPFQ